MVKGDGDRVWPAVIDDCEAGTPQRVYDGGKIEGAAMLQARWDLLPRDKYMIASVQTVRGCPKHCSFCSVWRTDGQKPRVRESDAVIEELVQLRRLGFRFVALADDNFYPVTLEDLRMADRRADKSTYNRLKALRDERFELMEQMSKLPSDMNFFTQITMEAAEDPEYLDAMRKARIRGALVGIESVTPEGLKDVYKDFNLAGDALAERLQEFKKRGVHVLGSFIFGLPSDKPATFDATAALAQQANVTLAQFVMLTPFPGTLDFQRGKRRQDGNAQKIDGVPVTRHWLIPKHLRPKVYTPHPMMSADEIRQPHAGRVGRVLPLAARLAARQVREVAEVADRVRDDLETLPADVRQHRHLDRQRPLEPGAPHDAADRQAAGQDVRRPADAGSAGACVRDLGLGLEAWA